ncbi:MAG: redoxin domain-containing protein [Candidatus Eremiobacteraeota bacterium]|nr:redoxin domain-containing protein [Candidatus Eremiobacteraeota bacterium]
MLAAGDTLPLLEVTDDQGRKLKTSDWLGKPLVLWFYPKDDTPG